MTDVTMTVNGKTVSGTVEGRTLLVQFLRDSLGLTGTHVGCETSQCGACTIHLDGQSVKSCSMLAVQADAHQAAAGYRLELQELQQEPEWSDNHEFHYDLRFQIQAKPVYVETRLHYRPHSGQMNLQHLW